MRSTLPAALAALLLSACAPRYIVTPLQTRGGGAPAAEPARVLSVEEGVPHGSFQVGRFRLEPLGEAHLDTLEAKLRRDAARLGGNLLVIHSAVGSVEGDIWRAPPPPSADRDAREVFLVNQEPTGGLLPPFAGEVVVDGRESCRLEPGQAVRVRIFPGQDSLRLGRLRVPLPEAGGRRYYRVEGMAAGVAEAAAAPASAGLAGAVSVMAGGPRLTEIREFRFKLLPVNPVPCHP